MRLRSGLTYTTSVGNLADKLAQQELSEANFNIGPTKDLPIQPFNGTTDIVKWFARFELVGAIQETPWTDDEKKKWFPLCLTSIPMSFYNTLTTAQKGDWGQTVTAFKTEYSSPDRQQQYMARLSCIKQAPTETVQEFYSRLIDMATTAYSGISADINKSLF